MHATRCSHRDPPYRRGWGIPERSSKRSQLLQLECFSLEIFFRELETFFRFTTTLKRSDVDGRGTCNRLKFKKYN